MLSPTRIAQKKEKIRPLPDQEEALVRANGATGEVRKTGFVGRTQSFRIHSEFLLSVLFRATFLEEAEIQPGRRKPALSPFGA